jgi:hypothetical protein
MWMGLPVESSTTVPLTDASLAASVIGSMTSNATKQAFR